LDGGVISNYHSNIDVIALFDQNLNKLKG